MSFFSRTKIHRNLNKIIPPLFLLFSFHLFGATEDGIKIIDFRYSEDSKPLILNIGQNNILELKPEEHSDKYILVRTGVRFLGYQPRRVTNYYLSNFKEEICHGENITDNGFIFGNNIQSVNEKLKFFRSCMKFKVEDPNKGTLEYQEVQENCLMKKLEDYSAILSGGDCFIKAKKDQNLTLEVIPDPQCNDRSFLAQNNYSPSEMMGTIDAYIYPRNYIGFNFDFNKKLWEKRLFINLTPGNELLKTVASEENEEGISLYKPDRMIFPDIAISSLRVINQNDKASAFELGMLISTFGGTKFCENGLCSNYSYFDVPIAPSLILYEINSRTGKKEEIASSSKIGDRFPGQWNGETIASDNFFGVIFEKGRKYSIELIFSNPNEDYARLKKFYKSLITRGNFRIGSLNVSSGEIGSLGTLSGFGGLSGSLGTIGTFDTSSRRSILEGIDEGLGSIPRIVESIQDSSFPPIYSEICNKNMSVCNKSSTKENLKFIISFEVKDIQNSNVILGDDISVERISNLLPNLKTKLDLKKKPTIKCSSN